MALVDAEIAVDESTYGIDGSSGSPLGTSVSSKAVPEHCRTFYVFDDLTCNVVLGEELLDSINAFQLHRRSFVDVPDMFEAHSSVDFNIIKWANSVEKWILDKLHGSNSALSPKAASRLGIDFCPFNPNWKSLTSVQVLPGRPDTRPIRVFLGDVRFPEFITSQEHFLSKQGVTNVNH
jgi:hypothetical protein